MKSATMFALVLGFTSLSASAQTIVTAENNNADADICFYKQVQLKGYAYANLVGRCAWDSAINGMYLTLTAVSEDPGLEAQKIELDYIRNVTKVEQKSGQLQISVTFEDLTDGDIVTAKKKVIYVRAADPKKGLFSVKGGIQYTTK